MHINFAKEQSGEAFLREIPVEATESEARLVCKTSAELGTSISDLIKKRELNPRRAAALARARGRLADKIESEDQFSLSFLRLRKGLSQARLAELMEVQQPYIARVERGEDDLKFSTMRRLADALEIGIDEVCKAIEKVRAARENAQRAG